jgi:putative ABC transport system permease protein
MRLRALKETVKEALKVIYYYKLRTAFSQLGVAFGIMAICVIVTTIDGANRKAYEIFETLGPNSITVFSGGEREASTRQRFYTLKREDADAILRVDGVYEVVQGYLIRDALVKYLDKNWQTRIEGVTPNYFESLKWGLSQGTYFTEEDNRQRRNVCVLGHKVYKELIGEGEAQGKVVVVKNSPMMVLGVLEERGGGGASHIDDRIVVPIATATERLRREFTYLTYIRVKTERDVEETMDDIRALLRRNHGLKEGTPDDFTIRSSRDVIEFLSVIKGSLYLFLGTASAIALLVSGFVLSNLFFLSIQQRRRDIGIRRAYGATRKGILSSFLLESVMVTLSGGILGMILSLLSKRVFEDLFDIPMYYSLKVVLLSLLFSFATGLLSGLRPALRAADLQPYEAIRG